MEMVHTIIKTLIICIGFIIVLNLLEALLKLIKSATVNNLNSTEHVRMQTINERIQKYVNTYTYAYTSDIRFNKLKTHELFDLIRDKVMNSISNDDKRFLSKMEPGYEGWISQIIIRQIDDYRIPLTSTKSMFDDTADEE